MIIIELAGDICSVMKVHNCNGCHRKSNVLVAAEVVMEMVDTVV
jgi:hypothetical protein